MLILIKCMFIFIQTLYTYPDNFRAYKILIAAEYSRNKIKVVSEPPEFVLGQTNKTDEFLAKFPLGKVHPLSSPTEFICFVGTYI